MDGLTVDEWSYIIRTDGWMMGCFMFCMGWWDAYTLAAFSVIFIFLSLSLCPCLSLDNTTVASAILNGVWKGRWNGMDGLNGEESLCRNV